MRERLVAFRVLASEAFRDGLRRRFAAVLAALLVIGLLGAETCTGLGSGELVYNGREIDPRAVAGFVAPLLYAFEILALVVTAGVLASDHLARPLADGSAALWLARPVGRGAFAGARLAGALGVVAAGGVVLLGGTGGLLVGRQGLAVGPALAGAAAGGLDAIVVGALAMAASLGLGRSAVLLLVTFGVPFVGLANTLVLGAQLVAPEAHFGGLIGAVDRFGPPLGTAVLAAVAAWNPHVEAQGAFASVLPRLLLWAAGSAALLVLSFRRRELA
jgi:hypothetical protein